MRPGIMGTVLRLTFLAVLVMGIGAARLTGDLRVFSLGIVPAAAVAAALVAYFGWRVNLRRRILAEAEDDRRAA